MDYQLEQLAEDQHDIDCEHDRRVSLAAKLRNTGRISNGERQLTTSDLKEYFDLNQFEHLPVDFLIAPNQYIDDENLEQFKAQSLELAKQAAYGLIEQECEDLEGWA